MFFKENFTNYTTFAPGVVPDAKGIWVGNDPIWRDRSELNVNVPEKGTRVYEKGIAVPALKTVDLQFAFRFLNAENPVPAKPEAKDRQGKVVRAGEPMKPGTPMAFEVTVNKTVVRIASDSVTLNGKTNKLPFLMRGDWGNAALRVDGGKLSVFVSEDRKLKKQFEIPFAEPVTSFNFNALPGNGFSITDISVTSGGVLKDNPVEKHFADFRSLSQPLPAGAVKTDVTLTPDENGFAGVRIRLNKVNMPLEMTLFWDNGEKTVYPVTAVDTRERLLTNARGHLKGETVPLADAEIRLAPKIRQQVRSLNRLHRRGNGGHVPQYIDILREWDRLPSASKHPLDIDFVCLPEGGVRLFLDASVAAEVKVPARKPEKGGKATAAVPLAKLQKIEIKGNGVSEVFVKRNRYKGIAAKYYPVDLSANPRAKAFADAKSSLKEGMQTIGGVPYDVAKPMDSADIAICKQGVGNWALEVDEYLSRSPQDGLPSAVHFRIPSAPYSKAYMIFAIDPDPAKDKVLTVQVSHYANAGGNMVGSTVLDLRDGKIPDGFKQVGTVTKNGRQIPLYQAEVTLNLSKISDLVQRKSWLDLDFIGKTGENTEQLDNTMKPDPHSDSAFSIFAVTLEQAPVIMDFRQSSPGNVFTEDEKALTTAVLKATRDNVSGAVRWEARDEKGKPVFGGSRTFSMKKAGDTAEIEIPLKAAIGYYDLDVTLACDGCKPLLHAGRFAILGKDERKWSREDSPYATWWFTCHGSPGAMEIGGPLMRKAGIRKSCNAPPTPEMAEKYNILNNGNLSVPFRYGNIDPATGRFKDVTVQEKDPANPKKKISRTMTGEEAFVKKVRDGMKPHLRYDHIMIWHESAPGYGIPEELLNMPLSEQAQNLKEQDKIIAQYINECGRIIRKHFPRLRIQIGNSSASIGAATRPLRAGADPRYYDRIGIEIPSQLIMPEKLQECGFQGMMVSKDIASKLAKRPVKADGCWEFIYRPARDLGEQQQAEWHMRDILISLANDFNLISIGLLFDCTNAYYNHFYGASGIIDRAPYVYPKRAYVAYAALTGALDTVKFNRQIPTGSTTVYALEFKKADGTFAYAFWSARGAFELEIDNSDNAGFLGLVSPKAFLTEFYGRKRTLSGDVITVKGGTAPVYLNTEKPLKSLKIAKRSFPEEEARAVKAKLGSSFDDASLVTVSPDPMITSRGTGFLPIMKPGTFAVETVNDPEKGKALKVTLDTKTDPYRSKYITEFTTIRLKNPMPVEGSPAAVGVWVKGNSNWGQIRFEIEDAQGEIFKGVTTNGWGCDIYDWPGNTCVNFDGWCYVAQPLCATSLFCNHSPGPAKEQWVSCGGDKKIDFPIKVRAVTVGMNRHKLDLLDFKKTEPSILLRDFGGVAE